MRRVVLLCQSGKMILIDIRRWTSAESSSSKAREGTARWLKLSECSCFASSSVSSSPHHHPMMMMPVMVAEEPIVRVRGSMMFISRGNDFLECIDISPWLEPDSSLILPSIELSGDAVRPVTAHSRRISSLECLDVWRRDAQIHNYAARNLIPPEIDAGRVTEGYVVCAGSHDGTMSYWQASSVGAVATAGPSGRARALHRMPLEQLDLSTPVSDLLDDKNAVSGLGSYPLSGMLFKMITVKGLDSDSRFAQTLRGLRQNHSKLLLKASPFVSVEWAYRGDLTTERIADALIQSLSLSETGADNYSLFGFLLSFLQSVVCAVITHFGTLDDAGTEPIALDASAPSPANTTPSRTGKQAGGRLARDAKGRLRPGSRSSAQRDEDSEDGDEDGEESYTPTGAGKRSGRAGANIDIDEETARAKNRLGRLRKRMKKSKLLKAFPDEKTKIDRCLGNFIRSLLLCSDCIGMTAQTNGGSAGQLQRLRECVESVLSQSLLREMRGANPISVDKFLLPATASDIVVADSIKDLLTYPIGTICSNIASL